jgi:MerR family transcriptional regulator, light-induced transcriptional regulator
VDGIAVGYERPVPGAGSARARTAERGRAGRRSTDKEALFAAFDSAILPRLRQRYGAPRRAVPAGDIEVLTRLLMEPDERAATAFVDSWGEAATTEQRALDLLAPAARRLGRMWEEDSADFVAVTVGLGRLTAMAGRLFEDGEAVPDCGGRIWLAAAPGESHVFGIRLLAGFYRAAGWRVAESDGAGFNRVGSGEPWHIVGYTIGSRCNLRGLRAEIAAARRVLPATTPVFVGGPLVAVEPGIAHFLGADAAFFDAPTAIQASNALLKGAPSM